VAAVAGVLTTGAFAAPAGAMSLALASPEPPANVVVDPSVPSRATEVRATWTRPASAAADADVRWSLCPATDPPPADADDPYPSGLDAPGCTTGVADAPTAATVPTPTEGRFLLRVWFQAEGMADGPAGSPAEPVVIDRTAPGRPPMTVGGGVRWTTPPNQVAPIARAHWRFCVRWRTAAESENCADGTSAEHDVPLPRLMPVGPPPGYCEGAGASLKFWLEDAAGNQDPASADVPYAMPTPSCVALDWPRTPTPPDVRPAITRMAVSARTRPLARGRHAVTVTATLAPKAASGRIRLTAKGGAFSRTRTATVRGGRATTTIVVPRAVRRLSVRGAYAATATHAASTARLTVRLPRP
jgi:hypothetical protein